MKRQAGARSRNGTAGGNGRARTSVTRSEGAKAVTFTPELSSGVWNFHAPAGTAFNYAREVGDGLGSSVLVSLLCWLMRSFPEAPAVVERRESNQWRQIFAHDMAEKIRQPNQYYTGRVLWMATVMDFAFGNAYWLKVRNSASQVVELWWVPRALIRPISGPQWLDDNGNEIFIHHYEYKVAGKTFEVPPTEVVHFRFGMDPLNSRLGFTPLAAMMREIYVDDQASNFTASVLRNLGIIGVVVSPKAGEMIPPDKQKELKEFMQREFTSDKRGTAMVLGKPTDVNVLQYNLQGFDLGPIRDIAEERLSAALGIPAAVVGFGTGLQQTKVGATMRELIQQAWNGCIMPMQAILGEELDRSLLTEFQANKTLFRTQFDTSDVRALREDAKEQADRLSSLVERGIITLAEARAPLGFDVRTEHEIYYRPNTVTAVKMPGEVPAPAPPDPAAPDTPAPSKNPTETNP